MSNFHSSQSLEMSLRMRGFTLIELLIVVGIIAVILTLALPVHSNYVIRANVAESLSVTAPAKTAVAATCFERPKIASLTSADAGYTFQQSTYVSKIEISGPCTLPVITVTTRNTGASPDIVLTLTGEPSTDSEMMTWTCASNASNIYLPSACRS